MIASSRQEEFVIMQRERLESALLCSRFLSTIPIDYIEPSLGIVMNQSELELMSTDQLWVLHEEVAVRLAEALKAEKSVLESRLRLLQRGIQIQSVTPAGKAAALRSTARRPYAVVVSKIPESGTAA